MRLSVVVPSFQRPAPLARCLDGLAGQTRVIDEVVVVARAPDAATHEVLRSASGPVRAAEVAAAGLLAAMQAGARAATGDVIAFTDDDAVARPDWAQRLTGHFADPTVGAVGGRDLIADETEGETRYFGRITRWGKLVGNQHLAIGDARPAEVLKGVNMAFRRPALALPVYLRGCGTQLHSEIPMCAWARTHGWQVVFDPELVVEHSPAPRPASDKRTRRRSRDVFDASFNLVFGIVSAHPERALPRAAYGLLIGDRLTPGLLRAAVAATQRDRDVVRVAPASIAGQAAALVALARGRRQCMLPVGEAPELRPDRPASPA